ncbi:MAG TPA: hypothetical protein P5114_06440 [Hyphomicrobiaceae bacterium]|nr:hypothetical protein [Hyphomicrobiaceae bacterium]
MMSKKPISDVCQPQLPKAGAHGRFPHLAFAVIAVGLSGLGMAAATSQSQFAQGLEQALTTRSAFDATGQIETAASTQSTAPVSGSEAFWLDTPATSAPLQPVTWRTSTITRGDRFQFGGGREHRILEVTDVRQIPMPAPIGSASTARNAPAPLMMITLRDMGSPQAALVRMLVDADSPVAGLVPLERSRQANL